jgi:hypothetical protein
MGSSSRSGSVRPSESIYESIYAFVGGLGTRPQLKTVLSCSLYNRSPPESVFDRISFRYYHDYVKPKLSSVFKVKGRLTDIREDATVMGLKIIVTPSYLLYGFKYVTIRCYSDGSCSRWDDPAFHYLFGVDSDSRVFVNSVDANIDHVACNDWKDVSDNIRVCWLDSDTVIHQILGYDVDYGGSEEAVIDLDAPQFTSLNVRVQGDLVLALEAYSEAVLDRYIGTRRFVEHVQTLLLDTVNRILLELGLSGNVDVNVGGNLWRIILENSAPRESSETYARKLHKAIARELGELLGDGVEASGLSVRIRRGDYAGFIVGVRVESGGWNNSYNHLVVEVDRDIGVEFDNPLIQEMRREVLKALENTPPTDVDFNIGNHHVKLSKVKPLSYTYRPARQPLTLNDNRVTVVNPTVFIVTPASRLELYHREHGVKTIRFARHYIISFEHVRVHEHYVAERNRTILRSLEA